jgi:hypothetical protein
MKGPLLYLSVFLLVSFNTSNTKAQSKTRPRENFVYGSIALADPQGTMRSKPTEDASFKYFNPDAYIVSWAPFKFKSPELGIGWMLRRKGLYLNTGLSFWFGQKSIRYGVDRYSDNLDPMGTATEPYPGYGQSMPYDYYYIVESFSGKIAYYNLDWHLALGRNLGSHFAIFLGYQRNFLLYHAIDGGFNKRVDVITQTNPSSSAVSSSWLENYENNGIKDVYGQVVKGIHYIMLGFNYTHSINDRSLSYELQSSFPSGNQDHANHIYIRLKLSCALIKQKKTGPETK